MEHEGERVLSLGQSRVRLGFNPSGNAAVDRVKALAASCIDLCEELKNAELASGLPRGEVMRLYALAQTEFEAAAMWAVKAATA